jgi:hypothetical protein
VRAFAELLLLSYGKIGFTGKSVGAYSLYCCTQQLLIRKINIRGLFPELSISELEFNQSHERSCCGTCAHWGINASGLNDANAEQNFSSVLLKKFGLPVVGLKSALTAL